MIDIDVLFADKYKLETKLGEGGMGEVWIARNIHLEKRVALKVMGRAVSTNVEFVERFLREAVIASRVRHPAIVEVFDAGQHQGTPWIAMELLEGESLAKRLERGSIPVAELVPLLVPILDALHALHEVGVIHRDVKPDNIFLERRADGTTQPKLLDFGIAKRVDASRLTGTGSVIGTAWYLSPEQARNSSAVDRRADVYAMGVVLFECLSGAMPYEAESVTELIAKLFTEQPRDLNALAPHVPFEVTSLVRRCLARDADQRPSTTRLLSSELVEASRSLDSPQLLAGLAQTGRVTPTSSVREGPVRPAATGMNDSAQPSHTHHGQAAQANDWTLPKWVRWMLVAVGFGALSVVCLPCIFVTRSCFQVAQIASSGSAISSRGLSAHFLAELDVNRHGRMDFALLRVRAADRGTELFVEAFDGDTFESLWSSQGLGNDAFGSAESYDDARMLALISARDSIYIFDGETGSLLTRASLPDRLESVCRFGDGRMGFRTVDERVSFMEGALLQSMSADASCVDAPRSSVSFRGDIRPRNLRGEAPEVSGMDVSAQYEDAPTRRLYLVGTRPRPASAVPMLAILEGERTVWVGDVPSRDPMLARHGEPGPIVWSAGRVLTFYGTSEARMMTAFNAATGERLFDVVLPSSDREADSVVLGRNDIFIQRLSSSGVEIYDAETGAQRRVIDHD